MELLQLVYLHHVHPVKIRTGFDKILSFFYIATVDPCIGNSCQNGATCVRDGLSTYKCDCTLGFGGRFCNETLPSKKRFEIYWKFIYFFVSRM